ncbi:MAG: Lar family restriction alleviation protein, partial [Synergistaceae bacterium]
MSEKQELKPCPFCGKEVKQKWSNDGEFCSISCDGCGVDIGLYDNGTFLIEDWNNRKGEDALQSEIDRLNKDKTNLLSALEG